MKTLVGMVGFEPTQHVATDLQSAEALQLPRIPKNLPFQTARDHHHASGLRDRLCLYMPFEMVGDRGVEPLT